MKFIGINMNVHVQTFSKTISIFYSFDANEIRIFLFSFFCCSRQTKIIISPARFAHLRLLTLAKRLLNSQHSFHAVFISLITILVAFFFNSSAFNLLHWIIVNKSWDYGNLVTDVLSKPYQNELNLKNQSTKIAAQTGPIRFRKLLLLNKYDRAMVKLMWKMYAQHYGFKLISA